MRTSAQPFLWKWVWCGTEARGNSQMAFLLPVLPGSLPKTAPASPAMYEESVLREIAEPCMEDSLNYPEKKMDKLRLWSNKNKNDFPFNCRINTYLINLVWLICLKGRNRAYRTGWTNLQRALWWKNAWRTHGMNLLHCIEKCYALLIILYFISSITSVRFLSACFYFFVSLVWSSSDQVIKVKWCCFYWKAQWKPYNYWSLAGIFA